MEIVVWKKGKEGFNMWFETSSVDDIEKFYVGNLVELTRRRHWYLTVFHDNGAKVLVDKEEIFRKMQDTGGNFIEAIKKYFWL